MRLLRENAALGRVFILVILFSPVSVIPTMLHTRLHALVPLLQGGQTVDVLELSKNAVLFQILEKIG